MTGGSEDALELLRRSLRLAPDEAALYLQLCVAGPSKASELALALNVHRNEIYRAAERLTANGLVQATQEQPARYVATDLERVFDAELEGRLRVIEQLKHTREEVSGLLAQVAPPDPKSTRSTYKVLKGRREIYRVRRMLLGTAKQRIDWATSLPVAAQLWIDSGEDDAVRARCEAGVQFRALLTQGEIAASLAKRFAEAAGSEFRFFEPSGLVRFLIIDDQDLLMFVQNDANVTLDAEEEVAIHTTAPGFLHAQRVFFDQAWAAATPLR